MKLCQRVPIFGKIEIELNNESKKISEYFDQDLKRLTKIEQIGILHSFLNIPEYKKSDYTNIMLYLMKRAVLYNSNKDINFEKEIKLIGKTNFSSAEEFLKSWALLYSIGHLPMTFATEHAFMRYLCLDDNKKKFISIIKEKLNSDFDIEGEDKNLFSHIRYIIDTEDYMEIYKIFTFLKILNNDLFKGDNFYSPKIKELSKIMILRAGYLNQLSESIERVKKLEKMIDYFIIIRKLTYTILDGYISQNHLNLNYFVILENLDSFMESEDYQSLLDDINKFYTFNIFNSPESAYYHHRCVLALVELFKEYDVENVVEKIVNNDEKLEKKIKKTTMAIADKNSENTFSRSELEDHIRFNTIRIKKPVESEINSFKKEKIFGGVLYNQSKHDYAVDIYPNSELGDKGNMLFNVLEAVDYYYDNVPEFKYSKLMDNLTELYKFIKTDHEELYNSDNEIIEEIKPDEDLLFQIRELENNDLHKLILLINQFTDVAKYLFVNSVSNQANFSSWDLGSYYRIDFPILFRKTELGNIINILKDKAVVSKELELKKNIEQLESELDKEDNDKKTYYVFSPNTDFLRETEIDFMLIKFKLEEKEKIVRIGEVKPKSNFTEDQCIKQIELIFNISNSSALALYNSTMGTGSAENIITVGLGGKKKKDMIIFEKVEKIEE